MNLLIVCEIRLEKKHYDGLNQPPTQFKLDLYSPTELNL